MTASQRKGRPKFLAISAKLLTETLVTNGQSSSAAVVMVDNTNATSQTAGGKGDGK